MQKISNTCFVFTLVIFIVLAFTGTIEGTVEGVPICQCGSFLDPKLKNQCILCPMSTYNPNSNSVNPDSCTQCPAGYKSNIGSCYLSNCVSELVVPSFRPTISPFPTVAPTSAAPTPPPLVNSITQNTVPLSLAVLGIIFFCTCTSFFSGEFLTDYYSKFLSLNPSPILYLNCRPPQVTH